MRALRDRLLNDHQSTTWMSGGAVVVGALLFFLLAANDYQLTVGGTVGIDALAAMGLTVVAGRAGQLALGQAGFMAVGAYAAAYGTTHMGISFIVAVIMGVAIAAFLGLVVGYIALRLRGNYLAMATLAFGAIIYGLLQVQGKLGGLGGIFGIPPLKLIGTFDTPRSAYLFIWAVVIVAFVAVALYLRGRAGRELSALRDDELAAATVGVHNTFRKLQAFTLSAVLGAIAGSILAANSTVIDPSLFQPLDLVSDLPDDRDRRTRQPGRLGGRGRDRGVVGAAHARHRRYGLCGPGRACDRADGHLPPGLGWGVLVAGGQAALRRAARRQP